MAAGIRGGSEVYERHLEGRTEQPTGPAVRSLHSEEAEKWYGAVYWGYT